MDMVDHLIRFADPATRRLFWGAKVIDISEASNRFYHAYIPCRDEVTSTGELEFLGILRGKDFFGSRINAAPPFECFACEMPNVRINDQVSGMVVLMRRSEVSQEQFIAEVGAEVGEIPRWCIGVHCFIRVTPNRWIETNRLRTIYVHGNGELFYPAESTFPLLGFATSAEVPEEEVEIQIARELMMLAPLLFALTMLHCKNVKLVPTERKRPPRHERHTYLSTLEHHTIVVSSMSKKANGPSIGSGPGQHRLHGVRGHFKTYTADAPLFGRLVGMYWWDSHEAGSPELGIITSDYKV